MSNSREPLYIVNRPGNVPSHDDSARWIDKSLDLVCDSSEKVRLRGDTDFSLTGHLDKWDQRCTFIFGMDARANLTKIADALDPSHWQILEKKPRYQIKTKPRRRRPNVKQQVVKRRRSVS